MSWTILQSSRASPGQSTALLILITRPSALVTMPSSSSWSEPGRTTSAKRALSLRKKSMRHVELELLQHAADEGVVGQRDHGVEAEAQQAPDLARSRSCGTSRSSRRPGRGRSSGATPHTLATWARCSGFARSRPPGKLVALLAVLAPALAVPLAGDGRVAAALAADAPRGEHDVDRPQAVLDAVAVVLDAAGVEQEARLRRAPPFRGLADRPLRDARHLRGAGGRPLGDRCAPPPRSRSCGSR